jgi:hypothetical protein
MKTQTAPTKSGPTHFKSDTGIQPVRVIKAAQASKILGLGHNHAALQAMPDAHKKPEIRLVHAGSDYCDLEVVCGCGESTQVRCWNTPVTAGKVAV